MTVTSLFDATERQMGLGTDRGRIDVCNPVVELAQRTKGGADVTRVDSAREPVADTVVDSDRFLEI